MIRACHQLNRRRLLQLTGAAAACGIATSLGANPVQQKPLIDTHVYLGHWPLRRLATTAPADLVALLRRAGVTQAWAGSFDGLFHKDIHGANRRLAETCRDVDDGLLIPIGTINPTLPDWEEDVRRCNEVFKMPGIRLHPAHHGYALDDPRFARLLELAAARDLLVQLVVQMSDERRRLLTPRVPNVDLAPLARIVQPMRGLRLLIANGLRVAMDVTRSGVAKTTNVCFDFSGVANGDELRKLVSLVSADRIVAGTAAPLLDMAASSKMLQQAKLTADKTAAIRHGNALRLISSTS